MSFFRTKQSKQRLEEYMSGGKIEAKEPLAVIPSTDVDEKIATVSVKETETVAEIPSLDVTPSEVSLTAEGSEPVTSEEIISLTTEIKIEEVKDEVPTLPEIPNQLHDERKEEFLGLSEEGKVEEEKKDDENKEKL